jgi:hypothetical protein
LTKLIVKANTYPYKNQPFTKKPLKNELMYKNNMELGHGKHNVTCALKKLEAGFCKV